MCSILIDASISKSESQAHTIALTKRMVHVRSRITRRLSPATAIAACLALAVTSAPASASDPEPAKVEGSYAVFNTPGENGERDFAVEEHIIELIDGTPSGAEIHGSMFSWTRDTVAQALAAAQERGVEVSLAIDAEGNNGSTNNDPDNEAIKTLKGAGLTELVFCTGDGDSDRQQTGCIADRDYSINHNKLFAFSETGDMTNVVVSASQNMTNSQNNLFNNAVVIHGDAQLYAYFGTHFDNLLAQKKNNDYFNSDDGYFRTEDNSVTAYMFPRADSSGGTDVEAKSDTVNLVLGYINAQPSDCALDVVQAQFTSPRMAVADQLVRIAKLGCTVRVVYGSMSDSVLSTLSGTENLEVKRFEDNSSGNENVVSVHSKYLLFEGKYNETADRQIVFTGSHNLTGPSLRNHDENLLKIENATTTGDFAENFETVWSRAKCESPETGACP